MFNENLALFNELARACGNRYLAVKFLAQKSRILGKQTEGIVLESKLISWALTGIQPYDDKELEKRKYFDSDIAQLEDYLCYVDDEEICEQVRKYYKLSVRNKHVTLDASNTLDEYRQMRVNVILRMIWYELPEHYEGGYMAKIKLEELKYVAKEKEVAVEDNDTEVMETEREYEFEDAAPEDPVEESTEEVEPEVAVEPEEEAKETSLEEAAKPAATEEIEHKTIKVAGKHIYSKPSKNIPARVFTGNVEIIGHIDCFTIVKYVRPGFGSITGYIPDEMF